MSTKTFIQGKQAALEDSIAKMHSLLTTMEFEIEENTPLNPVKNIYSQHIFDRRCPGIFTNGKGACDKATLASALGEFLERLSTNYFFSDYYLDPQNHHAEDWLYYPDEKRFDESNWRTMMPESLWAFYEGVSSAEEEGERALDEEHDFYEGETGEGKEGGACEALTFNDLLSFNDDADCIRAIPLVSEQSGQAVYLPMNLLSNLYASNGLSAGNTVLEAKIQGLSEVFERWVKNRILRENICLPLVPDEVVQKYPQISEAIAALNAEGLGVQVRDASLGGIYPVVNVTLFNLQEGTCFASFGAHPLFEVALERTLTESLQGRHLKKLDGFQTPVHDAFLVASDENIENHFIDSSGFLHHHFISDEYDVDYSAWPEKETLQEQYQQLCELVWQEGSDVYVAQYLQYGFSAVRLIVPGLSEIYPLSELTDNNQNFGRLLREALLDDFDPEEVLDRIDALGFSSHQGVASLIGLMPDQKSFWGQMNIVQLQFWCYLQLGDLLGAQQACEELQFYLAADNPHRLWFKACMFVFEQMEEQQTDFSDVNLAAMQSLFPEEICQSVVAHLTGQVDFMSQAPSANIFEGSSQHQAMLAIYQGLRTFKEAPDSLQG